MPTHADYDEQLRRIRATFTDLKGTLKTWRDKCLKLERRQDQADQRFEQVVEKIRELDERIDRIERLVQP